MRKALWLIAAIVVGAGCGEAPPPPPPAGSNSANAQVTEMKAKLEKMSPTERAEYIKTHPEEFQKLGGF